MHELFNANLLSLNVSKTYFTQCQSKNIPTTVININYKKKTKSNNTNLKFLGLLINNTSWKSHIEMISPKLNQVCFTITIKG
jgi:hypothetical protein